MGSGLTVPKVHDPGEVKAVKWSFCDNGRWTLYPPIAQRAIIDASQKGEASVDIRVYGRKFRVELTSMKEIGASSVRDIKCKVVLKAGEQSPQQPLFGDSDISEKDRHYFEDQLLHFLVGNSIRYADMFGLIDKDRNRFISKQELHNFFTSQVWHDTPMAMTERVFSAMEEEGNPGRVDFEAFEKHASAFSRVALFEESKQQELQAAEEGQHGSFRSSGSGSSLHATGGTNAPNRFALAQYRAASASASALSPHNRTTARNSAAARSAARGTGPRPSPLSPSTTTQRGSRVAGGAAVGANGATSPNTTAATELSKPCWLALDPPSPKSPPTPTLTQRVANNTPAVLTENWLVDQRAREAQLRLLFLTVEAGAAAVGAVEKAVSRLPDSAPGEAVGLAGSSNNSSAVASPAGSSSAAVVPFRPSPNKKLATNNPAREQPGSALQAAARARALLAEVTSEWQDAKGRHREFAHLEASLRAEQGAEETRRVGAGAGHVELAKAHCEDAKRAVDSLFVPEPSLHPAAQSPAASSSAAALRSSRQQPRGNAGRRGSVGGAGGGGGGRRSVVSRSAPVPSFDCASFERLCSVQEKHEDAEAQLFDALRAQAKRCGTARETKALRGGGEKEFAQVLLQLPLPPSFAAAASATTTSTTTTVAAAPPSPLLVLYGPLVFTGFDERNGLGTEAEGGKEEKHATGQGGGSGNGDDNDELVFRAQKALTAKAHHHNTAPGNCFTLATVATAVRASAVSAMELLLLHNTGTGHATPDYNTKQHNNTPQAPPLSPPPSTPNAAAGIPNAVPTTSTPSSSSFQVLEASQAAAAAHARGVAAALEQAIANHHHTQGSAAASSLVVDDVRSGCEASTDLTMSSGARGGGGGVAYKSLFELRGVAQRVFEGTVPKGPVGALVGKAFPSEGEPGYYAFAESSLGQVLFNERGMVAEEFLPHQTEISPYFHHLKGDRAAWGALLTSIFNQWSRSPRDFRAMACKNMRYVVFDRATRSVGFHSLLREDWATLHKEKHQNPGPLRKALASARERFNLSKLLDNGSSSTSEGGGVDFFVSHNWSDENAPHRWAALTRISDLYCQRYGRLPRFWLDRFCIDQTKPSDIAAATSMLPATLTSCKAVLVLQSPYYLGCSTPQALPSLWCIVEFFTLCSLAPHDDPTRNLVWVPLFDATHQQQQPPQPSQQSSQDHMKTTTKRAVGGAAAAASSASAGGSGNVPPKLDLLHGRVYCFSDVDKERLLTQLSCCPGGLVEVQRSMSAVWPVHFRESYSKWALLTQASGDGDSERVESLLAQGASVDLPYEWSPRTSGGTVAMVAATVLHEHWRHSRRVQFLKDQAAEQGAGQEAAERGGAAGGGQPPLLATCPPPRWKAVALQEYEDWFDACTHQGMVRKTRTRGESTECTVEVNIDVPFGLLPPTWQGENIAQAKEALGVLRAWPDEDLEFWACQVHESWLKRRRLENGGVQLPAWVEESNLAVPYKELVEAEKEKDRVVVRTALLLRTDGLKKTAGNGGSGRAASLRKILQASLRQPPSAQRPSSSSTLLVEGSSNQGGGAAWSFGLSGSGGGSRDFDEDGFAFDGEMEAASALGGPNARSVARQPLQAAVQRFLEGEMRKRASSRQSVEERVVLVDDSQFEQGSSHAERSPTNGGSGSGSNGGTAGSESVVSSCLDDPCVKKLMEAGADPIAAVNQTILGDPLLEDAVVFKVLKDLLGPLYARPPHCLSLLHNQLTPAGTRRLLRFKEHVNDLFERQQQCQQQQQQQRQQHWQQDVFGQVQATSLVSPLSASTLMPTSAQFPFTSRRDRSESMSPTSPSEAIKLPPLRSLCGLSNEAILANCPALEDDNDDDEDGDNDDSTDTDTDFVGGGASVVEASEDASTAAEAALSSSSSTSSPPLPAPPSPPPSPSWATSNVVDLVRFQAVHQPELRATSFLLLLKELTSLPHCATLTSLDLSMNAALSLRVDVALAPLVNLKRLACAKCPLVGGQLQPLATRCTQLRYLNLARTDVDGTLDGFSELLPKLRHLDLGDTRVRGSFQGLQGLGKLRFLRLNKLKQLRGPLFPSLNGLSELRYLDLSSTGCEGTLSSVGEQLPRLEWVNLEFCRRVQGSIEPLCECREIEAINVNLTDLSGGLTLSTRFQDNCRKLKTVSALQCPMFLNDSMENLMSPPPSNKAKLHINIKFAKQLRALRTFEVFYVD